MSAALPVTTTNTYGGGSGFGGDVFVAKVNNTGTTLSYMTYLGGKGDDAALSIAVDTQGNAYLTGFTTSTNFPTKNAIHPSLSGSAFPGFRVYPQEVFVTKLDPAGSPLYSTYLGGSANDVATRIAVDALGNAYVTG